MTHVTTPALSIGSVTIREHDGLYSLNDLHKASGSNDKHKPAYFLRNEQTRALIAEMSRVADLQLYLKVTRGRNASTYACRELVIAYAAWISAEFHLKVIRVFLDSVAPAQPALPPSVVNDIVTSATEGILERLEKQCLLVHWGQVIKTIQNPQTGMTFPDLTALTHACLARLQRTIDAEAYSAITRRAANQRVSTAAVSFSTGARP